MHIRLLFTFITTTINTSSRQLSNNYYTKTTLKIFTVRTCRAFYSTANICNTTTTHPLTGKANTIKYNWFSPGNTSRPFWIQIYITGFFSVWSKDTTSTTPVINNFLCTTVLYIKKNRVTEYTQQVVTKLITDFSTYHIRRCVNYIAGATRLNYWLIFIG